MRGAQPRLTPVLPPSRRTRRGVFGRFIWMDSLGVSFISGTDAGPGGGVHRRAVIRGGLTIIGMITPRISTVRVPETRPAARPAVFEFRSFQSR